MWQGTLFDVSSILFFSKAAHPKPSMFNCCSSIICSRNQQTDWLALLVIYIIKHRIGLGWAAFEKNKILLTSKRVPYHIKAQVYNTYILHVVLYGLECVNWTAKLEKQVETFQNHIMRFMTNQRLIDCVKIEDLLTTTTVNPIMPVIKSKVFFFYPVQVS